MILCRFTTNLSGEDYNFPQIRSMLEAATGLKVDAKEMMRIGERNFVLLKLLAAVEGYSRKDEGLPKRFATKLPKGGSKGQSIPDTELQPVIDDYYKLRGFDNYGPTDAKLEKLGLGDLKGMIKR